MSGQSPTLLQSLAEILARPATPADRQRAILHVLDWLGCAVAGASAEAAVLLKRATSEPGAVPLIGGGTASPLSAALINGAMGNVLEMDDVHRQAILHPGPVVVPAALSATIAAKREVTDFLDAIVRGYEAVIRIGQAVGAAHYRYFHNTATCGPFGAAAAAGSAFQLQTEEWVWALANAGSLAGGLWQMRHEPCMTKQLHAGHAAQSGLRAAQLARVGFTGPAGLLEGEQGFFAALCPDGAADKVVANPHAPWALHEVSFKPWPACRHAHAAIDAAMHLSDEIEVDTIEAVSVETYADAVKFCDRTTPSTVLEAKFSIQHAVAMVLLHGRPALEHFEPQAVHDPSVVRLRERVTVRDHPQFSEVFPDHYGARVKVRTTQGDHHDAMVRDAFGDPEWPMSTDDLRDKAHMLMKSGGMGDAAIDDLCDATLALLDHPFADWCALLEGSQ